MKLTQILEEKFEGAFQRDEILKYKVLDRKYYSNFFTNFYYLLLFFKYFKSWNTKKIPFYSVKEMKFDNY